MDTRKAALIAVAALAATLLVASVVSAAVQRTRDLPVSFVVIARDGESADVQSSGFLESDLNRDGSVNDVDLLTVLGYLGTDASDHLDGDINGDGRVDVLDLATVGRHYGSSQDP